MNTPDLSDFQQKDANGQPAVNENGEPKWIAKPQIVTEKDVKRVLSKGRGATVHYAAWQAWSQYQWFRECLHIQKCNEVAQRMNEQIEAQNARAEEEEQLPLIGLDEYPERPEPKPFEQWFAETYDYRQLRAREYIVTGSEEGTFDVTVGEYLDAMMGQLDRVVSELKVSKVEDFAHLLTTRANVKVKYPKPAPESH
jgi:hypothetical protein